MKGKGIVALVFLLLISLLFTPFSHGKDSVIHDLEIKIRLEENGEALVEEVWDAEVYQGTEVYLVKSNLTENQMSITDLQVRDESGRPFLLLDPWNPSASRQEKAYKAGYNPTSSGVELCFGIGDYGSHVYKISYRVKNFLVGYKEGTPGFHVRVINDGMSAPIKNMKVTVEKSGVSFSKENAKIWAFGYEGDIFFLDGKMVATSYEELGPRNYVNIMASFSPEMFRPAFQNPKTFDEVKEKALKGSDEDLAKKSNLKAKRFVNLPFWVMVLVFTSIFISFTSFLYPHFKGLRKLSSASKLGKSSRRALKEKIKSSSQDYERDPPFAGDLSMSYGMLGFMKKAKLQHLISALILQWIKEGYLHLQKEETSSFFGLKKADVSSLGGLDKDVPDDPLEKRLFIMMKKASGSDGILQEKEFYRWSKKEFAKIESWHSSYRKQGEKKLEKEKEISPLMKKKSFGLFTKEERDITDKGLEHVGEIIGFQHFLKDFTLISQREALDVDLWEEYLIYGALLGIADQVAEDLESYQPGIFQDSSFGSDFSNTLVTISMANSMSHAMSRGSATGLSSSSGGGGFSSSGGGGGFSGGGSGGGFR